MLLCLVCYYIADYFQLDEGGKLLITIQLVMHGYYTRFSLINFLVHLRHLPPRIISPDSKCFFSVPFFFLEREILYTSY